METKRLALAFALSAAVLIVWSILFPPPKSPAGPARPTPAALAARAGGTPLPAPAAGATPAALATAAPAAAPAPSQSVEPIGGTMPTELVVATNLYTARVSNRGGELTSFVLSAYRDARGEKLELVRKGPGYPGAMLRLEPSDPFLERARTALYDATKETKGSETRIDLRYREADGQGIRRTYTFRPGYVMSLRVEREGPPGQPVAVVIGPGIDNPTPEELKNRYISAGGTIVLDAGESVDRHAKDGLKEPLLLGKGLGAVGIEDNYFLAAFLPVGDANATLRPVLVPATEGKKQETDSEVVLGATQLLTTDVFIGPKALDILETLRPGMGRMIDYGWYAVLVKPLLWSLRAIHGWVGNWGVAIIIITIFIKVLLYPLTHKQLLSMKKMQKVQPKVETIRAKWAGKIKTDPQARMKMNEEMMGLYKTEGINPAGGCLPLLLQMPILIAFYNLLAHSIELRHAPFALWLTDLSAKDPYYVTPILMTLTMWIQQQLTPMTGDPTQRKIFAMMPFVMGFFFKDVPSGLVLYWLVQNILTIIQQLILNKYTDLGPASMKKEKTA